MKAFTRFAWLVPAAALAVGMAVLAPGLTATAGGTDLPTPTGASPTALTRSSAAPTAAVVDGRSWNVMAKKGTDKGF